MVNIEKTIEQYDLLWANWRSNNRTFDDFKGELAKLSLTNEGQNEATANNSQQISITNQSLMNSDTKLNTLTNELVQVSQSVASVNANVETLSTMRSDLETLRQSLNSGDSTVLGLVGRLEYIEQSLESVNAHRLQINESLFRLQETIEALQRAANGSSSSL
jgi:chromosome segregation ATPase